MQRRGGGGYTSIKRKVQGFRTGHKFHRTNAEFVVDSRHNLWIPVYGGGGRNQKEERKASATWNTLVTPTTSTHTYLQYASLNLKIQKATYLFPRTRRIRYIKYNTSLLPLMYLPSQFFSN